MNTAITTDISMLSKYISKNLKKKIKLFSRLFAKKEKTYSMSELLNQIIKFQGVKDLGGEPLGQQFLYNRHISFYRLKKESMDMDYDYIYVAYVVFRDKSDYQVVISEDWANFYREIEKAISTNDKVVFTASTGVKKGGFINANRTNKYGRKKL